jgi:cholesterol transport system auxiliary component
MKKIKILLLTIGIFVLNGCLSSSNYFVLSVASQPKTVYSHHNRVIGVEKVIIPTYLYKREIAVAKSSSQVSFMSGSEWGEDLDDGLTHRLISFLQKKFQQPRVYQYPWDTDTQPHRKVKVQITRFIAMGDRVYLDANWEVENLRTGRSRSRLFTTTVLTKQGNAASIVKSMDVAFGELEESIASGLKSF